ncbi:hypothetical protein SAMN05216327_109244 [Dyadobacter sp. SG02]|uniref:hypothetical protein n=1 Tax=Dyadobacter sp. SG02 TaxID=1855291 RepID=UPI0008C9BD6F|nr:hypothetical protein [Dyadobacter sp. SG02]SEJ39737.1 hypothetical protein SAMN05216327_109244 [Dyadobacter sp. SG02]
MFQLNPLDSPNAWWQHLLLLLVSGIIGYIIGYRRGNDLNSQLELQLAGVENGLDECRKGLASLVAPVAGVAAIAFDDLKIIEGIGPQIEKLLHRADILTYAHLSETTPARIKMILDDAGRRFQVHDPETWPGQAALAAAGKWNELKEWQNTLDGGKA